MQGANGWASLEGRQNALNAIRLGLATLVVVSHALILEGNGVTPVTVQMGAGAVAGFFGISGFLIAGSRDRMTFLPFVWRRILRLMPAYWVVLLITAGIIAPATAALSSSRFDLSSAAGYVTQNLLLMQRQVWISDTLLDGPQPYYEQVWNSALWTLPYEFGAYVVLGILFRFRPLRTVRAGICAVVMCMLLYALASAGITTWLDPNIGRLGAFFAAGATLYAGRARLPNKAQLAGGAAALTAFGLWQAPSIFTLIGPFPVAYLLLWCGARARGLSTERHDLSYGLYIYAFPLQQVLSVTRVSAILGTFWNAVASVAIATPFAVASWVFVERPAMRWRSAIPSTGALVSANPRNPTTVSPVAPSS